MKKGRQTREVNLRSESSTTHHKKKASDMSAKNSQLEQKLRTIGGRKKGIRKRIQIQENVNLHSESKEYGPNEGYDN